MQTQYETVFILTPVLSDVQVKETVNKFKKVLEDNDAELIHEENWGMKKLAYPIQNKATGFYQLFEFKSDPSLIAKLELQYKRDEKVMRFLTFKHDKYGVEFNERRRRKQKGEEVPNFTNKKQPK